MGQGRKERGSGPVTAILVLAIGALVLAIGVVALGALARGERSAAQHAADAAALAGAEMIIEDLPGLLIGGFAQVLDLPGKTNAGACGQRGRVRAAQLAGANGATLTNYCWNVFTDRVTVKIVLNQSAEGEPAEAQATSATRFALSQCQIGPIVTPTPTPTPTPTGPTPSPTGPPPTPPPPPPVETTMTCGSVTVIVSLDLPTLLFTIDAEDLDLRLAELRPRLVD